jgi:hypothetical protein
MVVLTCAVVHLRSDVVLGECTCILLSDLDAASEVRIRLVVLDLALAS